MDFKLFWSVIVVLSQYLVPLAIFIYSFTPSCERMGQKYYKYKDTNPLLIVAIVVIIIQIILMSTTVDGINISKGEDFFFAIFAPIFLWGFAFFFLYAGFDRAMMYCEQDELREKGVRINKQNNEIELQSNYNGKIFLDATTGKVKRAEGQYREEDWQDRPDLAGKSESEIEGIVGEKMDEEKRKKDEWSNYCIDLLCDFRNVINGLDVNNLDEKVIRGLICAGYSVFFSNYFFGKYEDFAWEMWGVQTAMKEIYEITKKDNWEHDGDNVIFVKEKIDELKLAISEINYAPTLDECRAAMRTNKFYIKSWALDSV